MGGFLLWPKAPPIRNRLPPTGRIACALASRRQNMTSPSNVRHMQVGRISTGACFSSGGIKKRNLGADIAFKKKLSYKTTKF
uniref:Uncharacterized protein n=1 Tax=Coptotermes formosanus TaxID=36987 RepID=R4UJC5_COPFO|nr:hypothetical protein [Coptotermes formosanus]